MCSTAAGWGLRPTPDSAPDTESTPTITGETPAPTGEPLTPAFVRGAPPVRDKSSSGPAVPGPDLVRRRFFAPVGDGSAGPVHSGPGPVHSGPGTSRVPSCHATLGSPAACGELGPERLSLPSSRGGRPLADTHDPPLGIESSSGDGEPLRAGDCTAAETESPPATGERVRERRNTDVRSRSRITCGEGELVDAPAAPAPAAGAPTVSEKTLDIPGESRPSGDLVRDASPPSLVASNTDSASEDTDPAARPAPPASPHTGENSDEHELRAVAERPARPGVGVRRPVSLQAGSGSGGRERSPPAAGEATPGEGAVSRKAGGAATGEAQGEPPPVVVTVVRLERRLPLHERSVSAVWSRSSWGDGWTRQITSSRGDGKCEGCI